MLRVGAASLLVLAGAQAGVIGPLPITTLAGAPVVAVGRVESVRTGAFAPAQKGRPASTRRCTAVLRLLRSMPELKDLHIKLNYYSSNGRIINGHPMYPNLEAGKSYVFPLSAEGNRWKLLAEEGYGLVAPAIERKPAGNPRGSKREFIIRELTNTLLGGSYSDLYRFGIFMQFRPAAELNDEIMSALHAELPSGDRRWLDISTALLANVGIPRRKLDELVSGEGPTDIYQSAPAPLAARTLRETPESLRRDGVVRNMLQFSAIHEWGTAVTLVPEFQDDPLLLDLLPGYLERSQKGAVYTACRLVSSGQTALLEQTLEAALRTLTDKGVDSSELNAACMLLLEHGADRQFEQYLKILRDAKLHDMGRYRELWQVAWEGKSRRVVDILAVLLDDQRRASPGDSVRFCDFAGALLQRFSEETFGFKQWDKMPLSERNAAVARARAWMNETLHGVR